MMKSLITLSLSILLLLTTYSQNREQPIKPEKIKWTQLHRTDPLKSRRWIDYVTYEKKPYEVFKTIDTVILSRTGTRIPARLYYPFVEGPSPMLAYYHGGGFTLGSVNASDEFCRRLCVGSKAIVMSVDYRLAPEYVYPAGEDDCLDATLWMIRNAKQLGGDSSKVILGGGSSGGYMTFVTSRRLRDLGIEVTAQFAENPVTDHYSNWEEHVSWQAYKPVFGFDFKTIMTWFWDNYVPPSVQSQLISPLRQQEFKDLPSTLIFVGKKDPLRDEAKAYASKLQEALVEASVKEYSQPHGFLDKNKKAQRALFEFISSKTND